MSLHERTFIYSSKWCGRRVVHANRNTITIAFTWHRVAQVARRNRRKIEEEGMGWVYLWTKGRMRMRISWTYYPLP